MIEARIKVVPLMSQTEDPPDVARARAFARLVDRPALDRAYRYATLILGSRPDPEDATHAAALTPCRRFVDLPDPDRFNPWFGRIPVNASPARLRPRRRPPSALARAPAPDRLVAHVSEIPSREPSAWTTGIRQRVSSRSIGSVFGLLAAGVAIVALAILVRPGATGPSVGATATPPGSQTTAPASAA